jgi:hypothetical protein
MCCVEKNDKQSTSQVELTKEEKISRFIAEQKALQEKVTRGIEAKRAKRLLLCSALLCSGLLCFAV